MGEYVYDMGDCHDPIREKIVRCRDCRWAELDQSDHEYRDAYRCKIWATDVLAEGFCYCGRRKAVGE